MAKRKTPAPVIDAPAEPANALDIVAEGMRPRPTIADPFCYVPPTEATGPKYAALRDVEEHALVTCRRSIRSVVNEMVKYGTICPDRAPAYDAINNACRALHDAIDELAPGSADKSAALRCARMARMEANECVALGLDWDSEPAVSCRNFLRNARQQACAAIALSS